ncbi:hypothetical protein LY78DRAFT_664682 [Colletotrichum sublineola]|nr:hypothetical protein LY78DRAFT_664682 [Colletotrichum sublineola]
MSLDILPFVYLDEYRVVVCKQCRYAVAGDDIRGHISGSSAHGLRIMQGLGDLLIASSAACQTSSIPRTSCSTPAFQTPTATPCRS